MSQITKKFNELSNAECRALSDEERGKLWAESYPDLAAGPLGWSVCAYCVNRRECENHPPVDEFEILESIQGILELKDSEVSKKTGSNYKYQCSIAWALVCKMENEFRENGIEDDDIRQMFSRLAEKFSNKAASL
jgi:hypothetical protein